MAIIFIYYVFYCGLVTAVASIAHGGDYGRKGVVVGIHTLLCPFVSPLFWVFCRRGVQAQAEMNYYMGRVMIEVVREAYPPIIGYFAAKVVAYAKKNPWIHIKAEMWRGQQEVYTGFVCGVIIGILTLPIVWLFY